MKALLLAFVLAVPVLAVETLPQTVDQKFAALESRINNLETEVASLNAQLEGQADAALQAPKDDDRQAAHDASHSRRLYDIETKQKMLPIR